MTKINLHIHSNHSLDGNFDINEIINNGFDNGLSYLSVTDHNSCEAYVDLDNSKISKSGTIVYGMEADALINNVTYDILCYGFNVSIVGEWAKKQYGTIATRQLKIYNKLEELCETLNIKLDTTTPYDSEKEYAHAAVFRMLGTTSENKEFLNKYNIDSVNDLYRESTMNRDFPLYFDMSIVWPDIETLAKIIHDNGGKIFLAHPYKYAKNTDVTEMLNSCLPYIDGIEISNEPKDSSEVNYLYNYAKEKDLLICAGSDYHGSEYHKSFNVDYLTENMEKDIESWIREVNGKVEIN